MIRGALSQALSVSSGHSHDGVGSRYVGLSPIGNGDVWYLDPTNGDDDNSGRQPDAAFASLPAAYAACTANQHDVVAYLAGPTGITLIDTVTWAKAYTHLVGVCAPTAVAQRARIHNETTAAKSPLIDITASGCIFRNLYVFQGVDDAASLLNVRVTGGRNWFQNVHFAGGGHATQAIDGGASLALYGAEECSFEDCTIGVDTIAAATGMMAMRVDSDAKRCLFRNCRFTMYAGDTAAGFVEVVDSAGFDRYLLFEDCLFLNDCVTYAMAGAFVIPSGMGSVTHRIILRRCGAVGVTEWDANNRGIVYADMGAITAGGNSGLLQPTNTT